MSYNGIGLQTPRGSGTSGFVEKSKIKRRRTEVESAPASKPKKDLVTKSLQDYDERRKIERECYKLKKKMTKEEESEEKIVEAVEQLRQKLMSENEKQVPSRD